MLPQKILKSGSSEMPFGNYSVCMAIQCEINVKKTFSIAILGTGETNLLTKHKRCICTRKCPVVFLIFYPFVSFLFLRSREKHILGLFADPPDRWQKPWLDKLVSAYNSDSNESEKNGNKMLKWTFGYYNFLTRASMIFIQENAAFIKVLIYEDWHN